MRRSPTRLALVALAASSLGLAAVAPSRAAASIPVSGSVSPTSATLTPRIADGNVTLDGSGTHDWVGDLTGTSSIVVHLVEHSSGLITYQAFLTYTGTTPCGTGTVYFVSSGHRAVSGPDRRPGDDSR
jgi:hypothetical protein